MKKNVSDEKWTKTLQKWEYFDIKNILKLNYSAAIY